MAFRMAAVASVALLLAASARAAERMPGLADGAGRSPVPTELVNRSFTLPAHTAEVLAPLGINLSSDRVASPVFLAPALHLGITDDLMVGIRHFLGLCLTGASNGCPRPYDDLSVEATWRVVRQGGAEVAIGAALDAGPFDPFLPSFELRVLARWAGGPFAIVLAPALDLGLASRDTTAAKRVPIAFQLATYSFGWTQDVPGNRDVLMVPATIVVQVIPPLAAALGGALLVPIDPEGGNPGDFFTFPVGGAVITTLGPLDVGASVTFANLLGRERWPGTRAGESRVLQVFGAYRW